MVKRWSKTMVRVLAMLAILGAVSVIIGHIFGIPSLWHGYFNDTPIDSNTCFGVVFNGMGILVLNETVDREWKP